MTLELLQVQKTYFLIVELELEVYLLNFMDKALLVLPATVGTPATTTITHSLNYKPFVIVQWCFSTDVSSGVATKMYPAMHFNFFEDDYNSDYGINEEEYESRTLWRSYLPSNHNNSSN